MFVCLSGARLLRVFGGKKALLVEVEVFFFLFSLHSLFLFFFLDRANHRLFFFLLSLFKSTDMGNSVSHCEPEIVAVSMLPLVDDESSSSSSDEERKGARRRRR